MHIFGFFVWVFLLLVLFLCFWDSLSLKHQNLMAHVGGNGRVVLRHSRSNRIVLRPADMEVIWKKWHEEAAHPGDYALQLRIQKHYYFCGNLAKWIAERRKKCKLCWDEKFAPKVMLKKAPPATIVSTRPYERVLMDHSQLPFTDRATGAT